MSAQKQIEFLSETEYWLGEEISPIKHEFFRGRVYARAGGTYNHTTLCRNVFATAKSALRGRPCMARSSEQLVKVEANGLNTYPDAVIFCPPARFEGAGDQTLLTPKVIFEVLSDSTDRYDRGVKFQHYQQIVTLTDYVLIAQNSVTVEHFRRTEAGWLLNTYRELSNAIPFEDLNIELSLELIYEESKIPIISELILRSDEIN